MPSPLRRLNKYLWRYKYLMIPGLLCALASAIISLTVWLAAPELLGREKP